MHTFAHRHFSHPIKRTSEVWKKNILLFDTRCDWKAVSEQTWFPLDSVIWQKKRWRCHMTVINSWQKYPWFKTKWEITKPKSFFFFFPLTPLSINLPFALFYRCMRGERETWGTNLIRHHAVSWEIYTTDKYAIASLSCRFVCRSRQVWKQRGY